MERWIKAGELIREFEKIKTNGSTEYKEGINAGINRCTVLIANAPIVDAVPVVRCKDCKFYESPLIGEEVGWCCYFDSSVGNNHYCSYGERREDE